MNHIAGTRPTSSDLTLSFVQMGFGKVRQTARHRHSRGARWLVPHLASAALASFLPVAWVCSSTSFRHGFARDALFQGLRCASRRSAGPEEASSEKSEEDSTNVELFRQSLIQGWGGSEVGRQSGTDWAIGLEPEKVRAGDVLLADPGRFFGEGTSDALQRVGLRGRIPADLPRRERLRFLPVVLLTEVDEVSGQAQGVWLTMRTGRLMGDYVNHFHSRPLLSGGPSEASLMMVHPYPQVPESQPLGNDGLYMGGSFEGAQAWVEDGEGSSLRFRFFVNRVVWQQGALATELAPGQARAWMALRCSPDLILSESDSIDDKPLWVKIAEFAGGEVEEVGRLHDLL